VSRAWGLDDWANFEVCVNIVAILPERERRKDVDNLVKGLLGAMEGSIYVNDRLIQHLSVRRVAHGGDSSWYMVHVSPVLDTREDVVDTDLRVQWAGCEEILGDT
jgi:hypothetical protein